MQVIGRTIRCILHAGQRPDRDVFVDRYVIELTDGECFELTEAGPTPADPRGLRQDHSLDRCIGCTIVGLETREHWPTPGLRLSDGSVLVMGAPWPYYWHLQRCEAV